MVLAHPAVTVLVDPQVCNLQLIVVGQRADCDVDRGLGGSRRDPMSSGDRREVLSLVDHRGHAAGLCGGPVTVTRRWFG